MMKINNMTAAVKTSESKLSESMPDHGLVARSVAGDVDAFGKLYEMHRRRVYSICLRMLGNPADAEDVTQDVFVQLFRKISTFRGESAFTTWLYRLTVNQVLMYLRKRQVRREDTVEESDMEDIVQPGTERPHAIPSIDHIILEQAISQLPPGYRVVFILHDIEGYEHEEIAQMLGCCAGTSKSQLHKARKKLRIILSKKHSGKVHGQPDSKAVCLGP